MKIVGLMVARDEELCCGMTVETVKDLVDEIVFVDHVCKDSTTEIVNSKCREFGMPLHLCHGTVDMGLGDVREVALIHGKELNPDWFFMIDSDMVFTNMIEVRKLAERGDYDQYWFRFLNLYGDINHHRIGGMNIPHMWLFRNVDEIQINVNYSLDSRYMKDPDEERFIGWNLNGIKYYDRIFMRHQQRHMREWNRERGTSIGVVEYMNIIFGGEAPEDYMKAFVLNRLRRSCLEIGPTAAALGMSEEEFKEKYMNYPDILKNWGCPFELMLDEDGKVIGREPDLIEIPLIDDEHIHQLGLTL